MGRIPEESIRMSLDFFEPLGLPIPRLAFFHKPDERSFTQPLDKQTQSPFCKAMVVNDVVLLISSFIGRTYYENPDNLPPYCWRMTCQLILCSNHPTRFFRPKIFRSYLSRIPVEYKVACLSDITFLSFRFVDTGLRDTLKALERKDDNGQNSRLEHLHISTDGMRVLARLGVIGDFAVPSNFEQARDYCPPRDTLFVKPRFVSIYMNDESQSKQVVRISQLVQRGNEIRSLLKHPNLAETEGLLCDGRFLEYSTAYWTAMPPKVRRISVLTAFTKDHLLQCWLKRLTMDLHEIEEMQIMIDGGYKLDSHFTRELILFVSSYVETEQDSPSLSKLKHLEIGVPVAFTLSQEMIVIGGLKCMFPALVSVGFIVISVLFDIPRYDNASKIEDVDVTAFGTKYYFSLNRKVIEDTIKKNPSATTFVHVLPPSPVARSMVRVYMTGNTLDAEFYRLSGGVKVYRNEIPQLRSEPKANGKDKEELKTVKPPLEYLRTPELPEDLNDIRQINMRIWIHAYYGMKSGDKEHPRKNPKMDLRYQKMVTEMRERATKKYKSAEMVNAMMQMCEAVLCSILCPCEHDI